MNEAVQKAKRKEAEELHRAQLAAAERVRREQGREKNKIRQLQQENEAATKKIEDKTKDNRKIQIQMAEAGRQNKEEIKRATDACYQKAKRTAEKVQEQIAENDAKGALSAISQQEQGNVNKQEEARIEKEEQNLQGFKI